MNTPGNPRRVIASQPGGANANPNLLGERLYASLKNAERNANRLGRTNGVLSLGGVVASAATTALTGWTGVAGPITGDSMFDWRLACILAAVLGFISTVSMGLSQQARIGDRLARSNECIGRLKSLEFALAAQTQSAQDLWKEYAEILKQYPQELR